MFAAVLFDLDNTLVDRDAAFAQFVRATFSSSRAIDQLIELDGSGYGDRGALSRRWGDLGGGQRDWQELGRVLAGFLSPQPRLLQALAQLAEATMLGIVTNGTQMSQSAKWRAAGLDAIVSPERLWISEQVGIEKPDPAIFQLACQAMTVRPEDCLFVGDDPLIDMQGAAAAGLSTMLASSPLTPEDVLEIGCSIGQGIG
jgi:putative hydrolase of the HAD superfamily